MGKQKSRSSRVSNGTATKARKNHEAKRQAKFAAKRAEGRAYEYKSNPYEKGSREYKNERFERAQKTISKKTAYAQLTSMFAKLENRLAKEALEKKKNPPKKQKKED